MVFSVFDTQSLEQLRTDRTLRHRIRRIVVGGVGDREVARDWETRLNRSYFACGCTTGAGFVLATMLALGAAVALSPRARDVAWWWALVALAGAALAGKGTGIVWASLETRRVLALLHAHFGSSK